VVEERVIVDRPRHVGHRTACRELKVERHRPDGSVVVRRERRC
jgi:hypothetical protein